MPFGRKLVADEVSHNCSLLYSQSSSYLPTLNLRFNWLNTFYRSFKKSTYISEENAQSTEYFRSNAEILRLRKHHVREKSCIIHPFSIFRSYYEMYMMVVWYLVIFYMPLTVAFDLFKNDPVKQKPGQFVEDNHYRTDFILVFLRILCIADIVMTFFTGYPVKKKRKVVMNPLKIAKHYGLSIYFITDLLASLPIGHFVETNKTERALNTFVFLRILRIPTLYHYAGRSMEFLQIRNTSTEFIRNITINYLLFHWFACVIYIVPQIRYFVKGSVSVDSWIQNENLPAIHPFASYIVCLYRAIGCLFCVTVDGFDLISWEEKLCESAIHIIGKIYIYYLAVLILNRMLRKGSLEIKYFEIISQVQAYMSQKQLPVQMQTRLLQFYDYRYNKKFFKERDINTLLSDKLRGEINVHVCSKLVQNVSILAHLPMETLASIVVNLKAEIYLANDIIIKAGSVGDCMYFLASGTVAVWTPSGKEVCHLQDGAYFGEISLVFKDKRRTANIVAIEICEVYKLDRKAFKNTFKQSTSLFKLLEDSARERMEITQLFEEVHDQTFMELNTERAEH